MAQPQIVPERDGDRRLAIQVGHAEAFALAASLQGLGGTVR